MLDALLSAIDDPDGRVSASAIHALKVHRFEQARPEIIACLDDWCSAAAARPAAFHPFSIAKAAVGYLTALGPPEVAQHFLPLLKLPWAPVRACAAWGIGCLKYAPAAPALIEVLEGLVRLPSRSDAEAEEARSYIRLLGRLGAGEAVPLLIRIAHEAVGLRSTAVEALTELAPEQAAPALVGMLDDPGDRLRGQLLSLMTKAGHSDALPKIRTMLEDPRVRLRRSALQAVAALRDLDAVDQVHVLCLSDPNPFVRPEAVTTLVALLGAAATPTLELLTDDTNPVVRRVATDELARLRSETQPAQAR
jgi:HEAT repeat protein